MEEYGPITLRDHLERVPCTVCDVINTRKNSRLCDTCSLPYHLACAKLTKKLSKELVVWECRHCKLHRAGGADVHQTPALSDAELTQNLPVLLGQWKRHIRVLARIPRGARINAAEALCTLIENVVTNNTTLDWARLFGFSYSALRCPKNRINDPHHVSLTTKIKEQINGYMSALSLPSVEDSGSERNNPSPPKPSTDNDLAKRVYAKVSDFDIKGAVRLISSDDSFAGYSDEVTAALREKHPPAPADLAAPPPPDATTPTARVTVEQVMDRLKSFSMSSASGPDGIRPGHLLSLTSKGAGAAGERLQNALTNICNKLISGEVPQSVRPLVFGASLCALSKKDGGVRPIAVGNTIRRLATKTIIYPMTADLREQLQPNQLGVGTPAGCEAALRATRKYMEGTATPKVILKST